MSLGCSSLAIAGIVRAAPLLLRRASKAPLAVILVCSPEDEALQMKGRVVMETSTQTPTFPFWITHINMITARWFTNDVISVCIINIDKIWGLTVGPRYWIIWSGEV